LIGTQLDKNIQNRKVMRKVLFAITAMAIIGFSSCKKTTPEDENKKIDIETLDIPASFDFNTTKTVELTINDQEQNVKYDVYTLEDDVPADIIYTDTDTTVVIDDLNHKIASGFIKNSGVYSVKLTLPAYHQNLFLMRSKNGIFYGTSVEITGNTANYTYNPSRFKELRVNNDILYAVNGNENKLYAIDVSNGDVSTVTASLPYKSLANAVDIPSKKVYISNKYTPFELGYYDLNNNTFTTIKNMNIKFFRLGYNHNDGFLYACHSDKKMYKIDPSSGDFIQTYKIHGFNNEAWGDLAFDDNGTLYFSNLNGIYIGTFAGNVVNVTKISDNTLPRKLTSLAAGSNGMLYFYTTQTNKMIEFDPATAEWSYFNMSQSIRVNDLGIWRDNGSGGGTDTDGDGVPDNQDDYPNDPERAFNNYFPGEGTWATLAFEDLWPSKGDYDFNDLVIAYNINQITNADNKVVEIKSKWNPRHNGAGFNNGFAFEMKADPAAIASVTGYNHTLGNIPLNANGTEAGQTLANIVVMDETTPNIGDTLSVDILFSTPVAASVVGVPPYNPYVIINGDVTTEVHLPDMVPTSLANTALLGTEDDDSNPATGRYYKTENNLPWGINIVYDFVWMKEKQQITWGYLKFADWATSGGTVYQDWYKDLPGYRDDSQLDYQE
jgi:LruC domain-containing protein